MNQATLTVTGATTSLTYNGSARTNGFTTSTLYGSDTVTGVSGRATGTNAGTYADSLFGATGSGLANYSISYVDGGLTIGQAALTITASNAAKTYDGLAFSGGNGVSYSGFVGGEGAGVLTGSLSYGGAAQGAINAGSYGLTASGLTSSNYAITYTPGTLTIVPVAAPLWPSRYLAEWDLGAMGSGTIRINFGQSSRSASRKLDCPEIGEEWVNTRLKQPCAQPSSLKARKQGWLDLAY